MAKKKIAEPWSASEIASMRRFAKVGFSSRELSSAIGRSYGACRFKAMTLGIRFKSLGAAHSRKQRMRWA